MTESVQCSAQGLHCSHCMPGQALRQYTEHARRAGLLKHSTSCVQPKASMVPADRVSSPTLVLHVIICGLPGTLGLQVCLTAAAGSTGFSCLP